MRKTLDSKQSRRRKLIIGALLALGFMILEFPGIIIVGKMVEPLVFGFPFLYVYIFLGWIYMCCVMFYAFRTAWGSKSFFNVKQINK